MGLEIGLFKTGEWNAITDVEGVLVGHETLILGDSVRTGVTIIKPHEGNLFKNKVMAAVYVTNGYLVLELDKQNPEEEMLLL